MKKALVISAIASNQGKTLLTMALLHHYKKSVRPYKCGPDFIDPQFHEKIAQTPSVNLDGYMLNEEQLQWMFFHYFDKEVAIVEGVMGYYDGMDKGASAYDVAKNLAIPSLLLLDGGGSYITVAAVLKGMLSFRCDNTIAAVVINNVSSQMHYELVKKHLEAECSGVRVCGWIQKGLESLQSTHLGLDLQELSSQKTATIAQEVLAHIELDALESVMQTQHKQILTYPFVLAEKSEKICALVWDENFSFIYYDNINYLKERYKEVRIVRATRNEPIGEDVDIVILPGGYVETPEHYARIKNAHRFRSSLLQHAAHQKQIYAECAGLIYLGERCDEKEMAGVLPITFTLTNKRERLGYYQCDIDGKTIKGHAFHYSRIVSAPQTEIKLYKVSKKTAKEGGFRQENIFATYLHTMWRNAAIF